MPLILADVLPLPSAVNAIANENPDIIGNLGVWVSCGLGYPCACHRSSKSALSWRHWGFQAGNRLTPVDSNHATELAPTPCNDEKRASEPRALSVPFFLLGSLHQLLKRDGISCLYRSTCIRWFYEMTILPSGTIVYI